MCSIPLQSRPHFGLTPRSGLATVKIVDAEELGAVMTEKLAELFDENAELPKPVRREPPRRKAKAA